jgi:hypothetical protein
VLVLAEGGRKGVIWLSGVHYGQGWRRFAGELRQFLVVQAAATLSPKKKGTFGNQGMKRLLRQVQSELDWVLARLVSKPKRRCKRVGILGLAVTAFGQNTGSVHEAGSGHDLDPGFEPGLGHIFGSGFGYGFRYG